MSISQAAACKTASRCASFERRKFVLQFLVFLILIIFGLFVNFQKAIELRHGTGDAELEDVADRPR